MGEESTHKSADRELPDLLDLVETALAGVDLSGPCVGDDGGALIPITAPTG
jgi:hypothetical protein